MQLIGNFELVFSNNVQGELIFNNKMIAMLYQEETTNEVLNELVDTFERLNPESEMAQELKEIISLEFDENMSTAIG